MTRVTVKCTPCLLKWGHGTGKFRDCLGKPVWSKAQKGCRDGHCWDGSQRNFAQFCQLRAPSANSTMEQLQVSGLRIHNSELGCAAKSKRLVQKNVVKPSELLMVFPGLLMVWLKFHLSQICKGGVFSRFFFPFVCLFVFLDYWETFLLDHSVRLAIKHLFYI